MTFLEVQNVSVDLGEFHLAHANLKLNKNDYMVIIGPTGSGKSVLLETIAGFYNPDNGKIFLEGNEITNLTPENRGISIVYQDYMLFPHMNIFENIAYGLKKKIKNQDIIKSKVLEMAELLKIDHLFDRNPETLSGGEKQRTAIARSLIVEPKILLMDEPFAALDVNTHAYLTKLIKEVITDCQTTCIHVSHNFNDVYNLAEQVAVMKDGKILQQGTCQDVFSKPTHNFVADFVGVHNVFEGTVTEIKNGITTVKLKNDILIRSADTPPKTKQEHVLAAVRPENIIISNEPFLSSLRNQMKGVVEDFIVRGPTVWVATNVNGTVFKGMITLSSYDLLKIEKGKEVYISFKSLNVKIIDVYES
ncbi:ATP-binding cassette domain-containing protein [Methanobacterium paludis]|uniref:Molybdate/tungstate import ATP-binding protein WtpC n=1 Tax=Methanobacterium paludis (strain DSM 25820 / JCM 18151 / SWAN1) TaxID=868131 RepID=F6D835_METPW|nr:ATP-binding cassette domain-containing protein [Methanobacterium paludis]AEG17180.1 Polyamine-transporting ATPase [Methanobacterium paludis]